jgi:nitrate reductase molybdenum cofactor assembly chaperone NarJ/NarW
VNALALVSIALRHPDDQTLAARADVLAAADALPRGEGEDLLRAFLTWWAGEDPAELRRLYVETFDFSRRTSLDLTYYTHGDRRQRGLALLGIRRRYEAAGLEAEGGELPDHLPALLEFAVLAPGSAAGLLAEMRPVIELLRLALVRADSPYAGILAALCALLPAMTEEDHAELRRLAREGPPGEAVGLEPFGPPEAMPEPTRAAPAACADAMPGRAR